MTEPAPVPEREIAVLLLPLVLFPFTERALYAERRRHSQLIADLHQSGRDEFGIVYLGEDTPLTVAPRALVGTVAYLDVAAAYSRGRWSLIVQGKRRFAVEAWQQEDPYPVAAITELAEDPPDHDLLVRAEDAVWRVRRLLASLGDTTVRADDPGHSADALARSWQLCSAAPLNPPDQQRLLEIEHTDDRLAMLVALMDELYGDFAPLDGGRR